MYNKRCEVSEMLGKTITKITTDVDLVRFDMSDGSEYLFTHFQDCCETVDLNEIHGDVDDLVGNPLLIAEVVTEQSDHSRSWGSETWTFYKFATVKGHVTLRFLGESNGYYSEEVDLIRTKEAVSGNE